MTHSPLRLLAPAKVNLYLEVVGKRPDGYHDLKMLMAPVSLFDELTLERLDEPGRIEVVSDGSPHVESGEKNLCHRAARFYFEETGAPGGVRVRVDKQIPVGAGLGGGSSDAAVTILGLEALFGVPLTAEGRARAAFRVGADVPFFFARSAAWVEGIGEAVRPLPAFDPFWLVIVHPGVFLSTAAVFSRFTMGLTSPGPVPMITDLRFQAFVEGLRNDLEAPAAALEPEVGRVLEALRATGAPGVLMSGSGSAAFGLFPDEGAARRAASGLSKHPWAAGWRVAAARTLSPGSFPFVRSTAHWGVDKR
ncbi:MAG: 4-(cytidine 5'-diphospho)-2-C-methyl-D-erythritol kinase [Deltaproteobacteria bacterium]|nr:4-(cytidine 5'-diphospho)-2-C-methyl-D-erythritol kinase [Deltaproteobacteria bacterium]